MLQSIAPAVNLKNSKEKLLFRFSSFFTGPVSPSGIYGTFLLSLMPLTTTAGIRIYLRGIAGFIDHRNAFTHVQEAILQSRDFNLRIERARIILIYEANIAKTDPAALRF